MLVLGLVLILVLLFSVFAAGTAAKPGKGKGNGGGGGGGTPVIEVAPYAETAHVFGRGDKADDIAIHASGYVIGTNKDLDGGLDVYDLAGNRIQFIQQGEMNNVDLRGDTVVASNRSSNSVDVFDFSSGTLTHRRSWGLGFEPYGICMYESTVVVTNRDGEDVHQFDFDGNLLRVLRTGSTNEGCVGVDGEDVLYVAEERRGIWRFEGDPAGSAAGVLIDGIGPHLSQDVEGLAFTDGRLIASSQGNSTFAVYENDIYQFSFDVTDGDGIDDVTKTDGIEANSDLNLLVVHDHKDGQGSNYKYVRLSDVFGT